MTLYALIPHVLQYHVVLGPCTRPLRTLVRVFRVFVTVGPIESVIQTVRVFVQ